LSTASVACFAHLIACLHQHEICHIKKQTRNFHLQKWIKINPMQSLKNNFESADYQKSLIIDRTAKQDVYLISE